VRVQAALLRVVMAAWLQGDAVGVAWTALSYPGIAESEGSASRELLFQPYLRRRSPSQEFSFELREGLIWAQVNVPQTSKPLNFLLDTGAGVSVVNLGTAEKLGLPLGKGVSVQGVGAHSAGYWPERLSATIGQVPLPRDYLAVDLNELSGACNCHVDGLVGADFFQDRVVQVDFKARKVRLLAASEAGGESVPLRVRHGSLQVQVSVNNSALGWARLDTGCASSLQWTETGKTQSHLGKAAGPSPAVAVGLASLSIPLEKGTVQLGSYHFENVSIGVHEKPIFPGEAGLLGSGMLSRFERVTIDAKSGHLFLQGTVAGN
jgi:predicted aspartyl protease